MEDLDRSAVHFGSYDPGHVVERREAVPRAADLSWEVSCPGRSELERQVSENRARGRDICGRGLARQRRTRRECDPERIERDIRVLMPERVRKNLSEQEVECVEDARLGRRRERRDESLRRPKCVAVAAILEPVAEYARDGVEAAVRLGDGDDLRWRQAEPHAKLLPGPARINRNAEEREGELVLEE